LISNPELSTDLDKRKEQLEEGEGRLDAFLKRFTDIEDSVMLYLYQNNFMDYEWMSHEILERNQAIKVT